MAEKWSINQLHLETGLDRRTIANLLASDAPAEVKENGDKLYWMRDLIGALKRKQDANNAALVAAQTRFTDTKADLAEIEKARAKGEVIEVETVKQVWDNHIIAARRIVLNSQLSTSEQDDILNELSSFKPEDLFNQGEPHKPSQDLSELPSA